MANWAQIGPAGTIAQVAKGFETAPFNDAIEVPEEVIESPDHYIWQNDELFPIEPTAEITYITADPEKVALAEAIIDMSIELEDLKQRITTLEGGA